MRQRVLLLALAGAAVVSIVSVALRLGLEPAHHRPIGTLEEYVAAQPVVSQREMAPLLALLRNGDVAAFNKLRTNAPYAGKRLDFRGSSLAGLRLPGANLSNSIFADVNLTGTDLNHASFRDSYLATAWMGVDLRRAPLTNGTPLFTNRTCLAQCDFRGAVLRATEYISTSEFQEPITVLTKKEYRLYLGNADTAGAIGLDTLITAHQ